MLTLQLNEGGSQEASVVDVLTLGGLEERARLLTLAAGLVEAVHRLLLEVLLGGDLLLLGSGTVVALGVGLLPSALLGAREAVELVIAGGDRVVLHLGVAEESGVLGDVLHTDSVGVVKLLLQPASVPLVVGVGELPAFALPLAGVAGSLGGVPGAALGDGGIRLEVFCSLDDLAEASTRESTLGDGGELHERAETAIGRANILAVTVAVADATHSPGQVLEDGGCLDGALQLGLPGDGGVAIAVGSVVVALQLEVEDPGEAPVPGPVEGGESLVHVPGPGGGVDADGFTSRGKVVPASAGIGLGVAAAEAACHSRSCVASGAPSDACEEVVVLAVEVGLGFLHLLVGGVVVEVGCGVLLDGAGHGGRGKSE